jgi:phosphomevalonate decarboxylase
LIRKTVAYTMQALVKYHGLRDWDLRIPFHDSISVNTTTMKTEAQLDDRKEGGVFIDGSPNASANSRLQAVLNRLDPSTSVTGLRIDSHNVPAGDAKGLGYSSSAGAALTLLVSSHLDRKAADLVSLSKAARLFAASASRSMVGGYSRLYVGKDDESTYAERFAGSSDLDLRMVIVPLRSPVRTEDAHKEVLTSPFFKARVESAQKRCDEMEKAILGGDLDSLGVLAEKDTMELHALTMTGENRLLIMSEDSLRIIGKVREMRASGLKAYFSLQTGPSVFINTTPEDAGDIKAAVEKLGYAAYVSGVGPEARLV